MDNAKNPINRDVTCLENTYFVKYGKGGVLVRLESSELEDAANEFNSKNDYQSYISTNLIPVASVQTTESDVKVTLVQENVLITRVMPTSEVTLETYQTVGEESINR
ncbi:hypothetical protein VIN01S_07110 [Vibrio inusitatus NBRC 102082]|uniref:Uncharacterized protein n=1 Tax=Vibrio inusitatus NBRC 102082 TaxID=1219070 RepID=A0A4Y3HSA1_9VIBR|nr:hypothetical protein [Vibrio inusitatus]GEA49907.1 hypothetical protein VIN01S_07110 [Vibrio inusitatus NBRC 102082]